MKIGQIEKNMEVSILNKNATDKNMLIGLDTIKMFKLNLTDNLEVYQRDPHKKIIKQKHNGQMPENNLSETSSLVESCDLNHLNENAQNSIKKLISENSECFSKSKYDIGQTDIDECKIFLKFENLITTEKPYRTNVVDQRLIDKLLKI